MPKVIILESKPSEAENFSEIEILQVKDNASKEEIWKVIVDES